MTNLDIVIIILFLLIFVVAPLVFYKKAKKDLSSYFLAFL